jgi:hypothetical protein
MPNDINNSIKYADPATPAQKIVPHQFFYSVFRNVTKHAIYVWWAGTHGLNISPGEYFHIEGDPRLPQILPRCHSRVESIKEMLEQGIIEFCSSPPVILDDNLPNGESMTLSGNNGSPVIDRVPLDVNEMAARDLPVIVPDVTFDETDGLIIVDWTASVGLLPYDKFLVTVIDPNGVSQTVKTAQDRLFKYVPQVGYGDYKFTVTIKSIDDREQVGAEVIYEHEEPAPPSNGQSGQGSQGQGNGG